MSLITKLDNDILSHIATLLPNDGGCSLYCFRLTCKAFKKATTVPAHKKRSGFLMSKELLEIVWLEPRFNENEYKIWKYAVCSGVIDVLNWLYVRISLPPTENLTWISAEKGYLEVLQWLYRHNCPLYSDICFIASNRGYFEMFFWAKQQGCRWHHYKY